MRGQNGKGTRRFQAEKAILRVHLPQRKAKEQSGITSVRA